MRPSITTLGIDAESKINFMHETGRVTRFKLFTFCSRFYRWPRAEPETINIVHNVYGISNASLELISTI